MIYMLSHGEYSDYHVDTHLLSDNTDSMQSLVVEFKQLYDWPLIAGKFENKKWDREIWNEYTELKHAAAMRMHLAMPEIMKENQWIEDWAGYFQDFLIEWLKTVKGFVELEVEEYRINYEP